MGEFEIPEALQHLVAEIVIGVIGMVLASGWFAQLNWKWRTAGKFAARIVTELAESKVAPMKAQNAAAGDKYGLTPVQAKMVLAEAKDRLRERIVVHDLNQKPLVPKLGGTVLRDEKKVEALIERHVERVKRRGGVRPGGKGFR